MAASHWPLPKRREQNCSIPPFRLFQESVEGCFCASRDLSPALVRPRPHFPSCKQASRMLRLCRPGGEKEEEVFIRLFLTVPLPPFFCTYLLPIVKCRPRRAVFVKKLPPLTHPRRREEGGELLFGSFPSPFAPFHFPCLDSPGRISGNLTQGGLGEGGDGTGYVCQSR